MRLTSAPQPAFRPTQPVFGKPTARGAAVSPVASSAQDPTSATSLAGGAIALVVLAVVYNALLAFLNARGLYVGRPLVVVSELAVVGLAGLFLLRSRLRQTDLPAILLVGFFVANALVVSLISGALFVDMARNATIIAIFLMVGERVSEATVKRCFALLAWLMAIVLLLESVSVESYARLFEPGLYFEQTRGIHRFALDEIGLFANAIGFDSRFSILNIVGHRTSSLFLEQVSLANFATVLTVFLVALWPRIGWKARAGYVLLIAGILVTNNSRTALTIALAAPLVYLVAPRLPRLVTLGVLPAVMLVSLIVTLNAPPSQEDNLVGRLGLTIQTLRELDLAAMIGARAEEAVNFADSGYTFVIYASTLLGLIVLWFFFSLIVALPGAAQRRASLAMGLYLFLNLMVSGTSVFSIKTGAVLWFLIGFLRREGAIANSPEAQRPA